MGTSFNTDAILSYSTGFEQKEPLNAESKQVQNIPMVSPEALKEDYSELNNVSQGAGVVNNNKDIPSKDIISGYSIEQIRQFISKGYDLSKEKLDKMSDEEVKNWVTNKVTEFKNDKNIKEILQKYPDYEEYFLEIFFESGFNDASVTFAIGNIFKQNIDIKDKQKVVSTIIQTLVIQDSGNANLEDYKATCENKNGLLATLNLDITIDNLSDKDAKKQVLDALNNHLKKIESPEERAKEVIRLIEFSNPREKKLLLNFIKINANKKEKVDLGTYFSNSNTTLKVFLGQSDFAWERAKIFAEIGKEEIIKLDETLRKDLFDMFTEGGYISKVIDEYHIAPERLTEIIINLKKDSSYISQCSDTEKEFIEEIYPVLQQLGINADIAAATSETMTDDEKQTQMAKVHNVYREHLGETAYRDVITGVYNYIQELQNQGIELNISYEQFAELMNAATNGNYDVVMNDILRGDGVLTELNMEPVQPREGVNEGASAYNPETGMFNVPDGDPYAAGENLAQQLNQLYTPSLEDTLPKPVQENHTASTSSKPSIISSFKEWQAYYAGNTTKALKNIVSNDVVVTSQAVVNKVIEEYKNFDKTLQSNILAAANGDWFGKLLNNTKVSALKGIFASGGFIGGIYRIQQANDRIKEEEKKTVS